MATHSQTTYHDTVSKMARKYSQYRLPQPSELVESDDDEYNNYGDNALYKQQSINSTSYNSTIIHKVPRDGDAEDTPNSQSPNSSNDNDRNQGIVDDDDDEEDEDILSETNTMISHKSLSQHLKKMSSKTSVSSRDKKVKFGGTTKVSHCNPMEEIREIQMDRELFTSIFDKYFDESKEGDVDFEEFKKGLLKLGVNINNEQISKLFDVLLMNGDNENDGYLDRDQFSDFLTRRFEAPQLVAFQDLLLSIIMEKTKKDPSRGDLFNADESQKWDPSEVSLQEMEMRQAMEQMVDNEMQKINASQEFTEELERRMADPEFCNDLNAENWDFYEVAYWVSKIGYDYAIKRFFDQQIDGNVLLYDINITMLINQLGITQLHSNKFMRNLNELKQKIFANKNKSGPLVFDYNIYDISIKSDENIKNKHNEEIIQLKKENDAKIHEMELKVIEINSEKKLFETKSTEKLLNLQRELNKTEEKFLKSQQEIVSLNSMMNELKENLNSIKHSHINNINDINNKHNEILKEFDNKLIDYNSMKTSYDSICAQLNESKQSLSALKIEYENNKQTNQLNIDSIKRQFQRESNNLEQEIVKLTKMNDLLSDDNKKLKEKQIKIENNMNNKQNKGPLFESNEHENNPYLRSDFSSPKSSKLKPIHAVNMSPIGIDSDNFGSYSLSNYVQQLQDKANDDEQNFGVPEDAVSWSCQEVAYWLTTIGMKKYLAQFMEQFVDGQILLNDINTKNLVSDLDVKSLHAPKIMRELNKLKKTAINPAEMSEDYILSQQHQQLEITEYVTNHIIDPFENMQIQELKTQTHTLSNDLSETRIKLRQIQMQYEEYKIKRQRKLSMNVPSLPNLSPESSVYSNNNDIGNHSDATTMTTKSGVLYTRHLRTESNATQRTAYSEGDAKDKLDNLTEQSPTPPLPQDTISPNWQKYVNHLETKNQELTALFLRADNNLKKYVKAVVPLNERINHLEIQNQTRKKTIDKLNKRIERRNETINKLKSQVQLNMTSGGTPQFLALDQMSNVSSNEPLITSNAAEQLSNAQEQWFNEQNPPNKYVGMSAIPSSVSINHGSINHSNMNHGNMNHGNMNHGVINHNGYPYYSPNRANPSSKHRQYHSSAQLFAQKKKKRRKSRQSHQNKARIILANDGNSTNPLITGYISGGSAGSIQSAPPPINNNEDNSILGSLTSMAYGYLMGSGTPGN